MKPSTRDQVILPVWMCAGILATGTALALAGECVLSWLFGTPLRQRGPFSYPGEEWWIAPILIAGLALLGTAMRRANRLASPSPSRARFRPPARIPAATQRQEPPARPDRDGL